MFYSGPQDPNLHADVLAFIVERGIAHRREHIEPALGARRAPRSRWVASALGQLQDEGLIRKWSTDVYKPTDAGVETVRLLKEKVA